MTGKAEGAFEREHDAIVAEKLRMRCKPSLRRPRRRPSPKSSASTLLAERLIDPDGGRWSCICRHADYETR